MIQLARVITEGVGVKGVGVAVAAFLAAVSASAAEPIKVGFSMSLTGGLANTGRVAIAAMKLWEEDVNAAGGLLGRPVRLDYYDDQSNPANVPAIYTKLLDVDHVDLIVGPDGTTQVAPAMPTAIEHGMVFTGLAALNINAQFHYPRYFSMTNTGADSGVVFSRGFISVAMAQLPKPRTIAFAGADIEFTQSILAPARRIAHEAGLTIVYDKAYPPTINDFAPIVRAIAATNPDIVYLASYPQDSVGMVRAISEVGFRPKMVGGAMVGLNNVSIKMQLGPLLNGIVGYENWLPTGTMNFPGIQHLLERYQAEAKEQGIDPLGWGTVPGAYAELQIMGEAVAAVGSLDQNKIAAWLHTHTVPTVWGDMSFAEDGEWTEARVPIVQYRGITGKTLDQFTDMAHEPILDPPRYKTGDLIYPYPRALQ
jgi:branched-chain amino acid transport system substrate-binding protein